MYEPTARDYFYQVEQDYLTSCFLIENSFANVCIVINANYDENHMPNIVIEKLVNVDNKGRLPIIKEIRQM